MDFAPKYRPHDSRPDDVRRAIDLVRETGTPGSVRGAMMTEDE